MKHYRQNVMAELNAHCVVSSRAYFFSLQMQCRCCKSMSRMNLFFKGALLTGVVPLFCVYVASILCWCLTHTDLVYVPPEFSLSTLAATELNDMEWN